MLPPTLRAICGAFSGSEEHTSELQSQFHLVCRLLLEKKKPTSRSVLSVNAYNENAAKCIAFQPMLCHARVSFGLLSSAARSPSSFFFFFNDTATTEIYTLSLHDALPI